MADTATPLTDTSDMIGVHAVFRDAFASADKFVVAGTGNNDRIAAVAEYYDTVLRLLRAHHEGEDELLTPLLMQRCDGEDLSAVQRIAAQHGPVTTVLNDAGDRLAEWRDGADDEATGAFRSALAALQTVLLPHLGEEEEVVLPIAARHISPAEWGELPGHALRQFNADQVWLALGMVFAQMTDAQRAVAEAHMPPPVLAGWNQRGRHEYESLRARLGD